MTTPAARFLDIMIPSIQNTLSVMQNLYLQKSRSKQRQHVVLDVLGGVAVGDHLVVGDDDVRVDAALLHGDTLTDRAEVVPRCSRPVGRRRSTW